MSRQQLTLAANLALIAVVIGTLAVVLLPADSLGDPAGPIRSISERESWVVHALLFALLGSVVGLRLAAAVPPLLGQLWLLVAAALITAFATTGEIAQLQIEGRNAALGDLVADLIGASLGLAVAVRLGPLAVELITRRAD